MGYDKYEELTTEYGVKGEFADYGIRIDKELIAFVEVKRVATKLAAKHLRQIEMRAVSEGVEWMILTNGVEWRAYHLTGGLPVEIDLALDVNLLGDGSVTQKANQLSTSPGSPYGVGKSMTSGRPSGRSRPSHSLRSLCRTP